MSEQFERELQEWYRHPAAQDMKFAEQVLRTLDARARRRGALLIAASLLGVAMTLAALLAIGLEPLRHAVNQYATVVSVYLAAALRTLNSGEHWFAAGVVMMTIAAVAAHGWRKT